LPRAGARSAADLVTANNRGVGLMGQFTASLPRLREGWTRRFVLDARGWCKDMDLYTRDGDTVEPLLDTGSHAAAVLQRAYTTRYESGR
jgi:hypothetical protein